MPKFQSESSKVQGAFSLSRDPRDAKSHERDTARSRKGRTTSGSGNKPGQKSDVVVPKTRLLQSTERLECKKTSQKSLTISLKWLEKIAREAVETGRTPVLALRFECAEFAQQDWIMVERRHYEELTQGEE